MADKKLNTGLSSAQVLLAFSNALHTLTADEILAEIAKQVGEEQKERLRYEDSVSSTIAAINASLASEYVRNTAFLALEKRVKALEGGVGNA